MYMCIFAGVINFVTRMRV